MFKFNIKTYSFLSFSSWFHQMALQVIGLTISKCLQKWVSVLQVYTKLRVVNLKVSKGELRKFSSSLTCRNSDIIYINLSNRLFLYVNRYLICLKSTKSIFNVDHPYLKLFTLLFIWICILNDTTLNFL